MASSSPRQADSPSPQDPFELHQKAKKAKAEGDFDSACSLFSEAVEALTAVLELPLGQPDARLAEFLCDYGTCLVDNEEANSKDTMLAGGDGQQQQQADHDMGETEATVDALKQKMNSTEEGKGEGNGGGVAEEGDGEEVPLEEGDLQLIRNTPQIAWETLEFSRLCALKKLETDNTQKNRRLVGHIHHRLGVVKLLQGDFPAAAEEYAKGAAALTDADTETESLSLKTSLLLEQGQSLLGSSRFLEAKQCLQPALAACTAYLANGGDNRLDFEEVSEQIKGYLEDCDTELANKEETEKSKKEMSAALLAGKKARQGFDLPTAASTPTQAAAAPVNLGTLKSKKRAAPTGAENSGGKTARTE